MSSRDWQKSSFSSEASNCLEIAASAHAEPAGRVRVRESDEPGLVLAVPAARLGALLRAAKAGAVNAHGGDRIS